MCCWMVLWVATPTTPYNNHILLKCVVVRCCGCCFEYPQQHILNKMCLLYGVVGVTTHNTSVTTHNTIQQHILLKCVVVVGTRNNTHNTIQQHILTKCVVVGTRNNTIQQHILLKMCYCGYSKQHPQHHTTTHFVNIVVVCHLWWCGCCFEYPQFTPHITLLLCVTYDDVGVVSSTHSFTPHHFNNTLC